MRRSFLAGAALVAAVATVAEAEASELELKPALTVSEEYNDNVYGTADGRRTDFITRVQPGAALHYLGPQLFLDASYLFDYRNYAKGSHGDEQIHNADLKGTLQFLNFLSLELGESLHRTTVDVARDVATESLLVTQTTQNIASLSPRFLWRLTERGILKTGYRYTDIRYFQRVGLDKREHVGFANFEQTLSEKLVLYAGYAFTDAHATEQGYDRHDLSAGFRYQFADSASVAGNLGNSWSSFSRGRETSDYFWDAALSYDFKLAVAQLQTRVQNVEDPLSLATRQVSYSGRIDRAFRRGGVGLSAIYLENYYTESGKFESRRGTLSATGRYEIVPKLSASGYLSGERFSRTSEDQYPYRITVGGALSYTLHNDDTSVVASYSLVDDRLQLDNARGEKLTNRAVIELRAAY